MGVGDMAKNNITIFSGLYHNFDFTIIYVNSLSVKCFILFIFFFHLFTQLQPYVLKQFYRESLEAFQGQNVSTQNTIHATF